MFNHRVTVDHDAIIRAAKRFEYQIDDAGLCTGIAMMAIQAILLDQLKVFDVRLMKIMLAIHRPQDSANLTQEELNDMRAFFEGVVLCQEPEKYADLFSSPIHRQESNKAFPLLSSKALEKIGGSETFSSVCASFSKNNFETLLKEIKEDILRVTQSPKAMLIQGYAHGDLEGHSVTIGYDPLKDNWYFIDANQLPTKLFKNESELAEAISKIYKHEQENKFLINMMPYGIPDVIISDKFQALQKKLIDQVRPVNATTIPERSEQNLLRLAVECRSKEWVKAYLEKGAMKIEKYSDAPILLNAVKAGNIDIVNFVLDYLPKINNAADELNLAVKQKDVEIARSLLNHGANPNKEDRAGKAALQVAVEAENLVMCELLIEHGADIDNIVSDKLTAFLNQSAENHAIQFLSNIKDHIEIFPWNQKIGKKITLDDGREMVVPDNVKKQWDQIKLAESGKVSWHAAAKEVVSIAQGVGKNIGRKEEVKKYYGLFKSGDLSKIREDLHEQEKNVLPTVKKKK